MTFATRFSQPEELASAATLDRSPTHDPSLASRERTRKRARASESMAAPPSPAATARLPPPEAAESRLASLVYDMSQQVQAAMENMLKVINEADQSSAKIIEDIEKCRNSALERKKGLEEEKKQFQRAAYAVIDMLNVGN
ncbi:hypothetical protein NL676_033955 [Syzygium grande]|nr:hypothetical protein NL676_033955 [Syzygium grande]